MATTHLDSVRHLEDEFAEAMTRLYTVGNGLAALRQQLLAEQGAPRAEVSAAQARPRPVGGDLAAGGPPPAVVGPAPSGPPSPVGTFAQPSTFGSSMSTASAAPQGARPGTAYVEKPDIPWWQREGMVVRLLGIVGAAILLAGVAMLLVFAIQHGYLGPAFRVAGAAVLAVALVGVAMRLHRDPQRAAGAVAMAAAGYATAYLDLVAVTVTYEWIDPIVGLGLAAVVAVSGVVLARAWDRQLLALITVAGAALLAPAVGDGDVAVTAFLVVLAVATYPAHIGRQWLLLHPVRIVPAAAAILLAPDTGTGADLMLPLALVLAGFDLGTTVLSTRVPINTVPAKTGLEQPRGAGGRAGLLAPVLVVSVIPLLDEDRLPRGGWLVLAAAAAAYAVAAALADDRATGFLWRASSWAGGISAGVALVAGYHAVPERWESTVYLAVAVFFAGTFRLSLRPWSAVATLVASVGGGGAYAVTLARVLDKSAAGRFEVGDVTASLLLLALVLVLAAAVTALAAGVSRVVDVPVDRVRKLFGWVLWPLALGAASCAVVAAAAYTGGELGDAPGGFVLGHGVATLTWAGGAAYLLMHGLKRSRDASLALRLGLVVAAVAVGKLVFFDLPTLDGLVRIAAFIGAGLLILTMGTSYAKALERVRAAT